MLAACLFSGCANATTITIIGNILQSTLDGTGPAMNNPSLNAILDNSPYSVTLVFPGSINAPGTFGLTGSSLLFSVPSASATEGAFNLISLTVTANGSFDDISLLGCLTTGSGCFVGNQLTANFRIPAASLNSVNIAATGLDQPHPLDLLEDDSFTDIHGSIATYSYFGNGNATPEPSTGASLLAALIALTVRNFTIRQERKQ